MANFAIIEVEDGLMVVAVEPDKSPEDAAIENQGVLVDPGPYATYDEACDALSNLELEDEERPE